MTKRSRTLERRKEREKQRRRNRQLMFMATAVVVAIVTVLLIIVSNEPADAPIPEGSAERYADVPVSISEEGFPRLGNPEADVDVKEYSSFTCPHCRSFHEDSLPDLIERARDGEILFIFVPVSAAGDSSEVAAKAVICGGEQGKYWEMIDALFEWQGLFGNSAYTTNRLLTGADALGLDRGQFTQCFDSASTAEVLAAARQAAIEQDIGGTPSVAVNGVLLENRTLETINAAIDSALQLAGGRDADAESTEEPETGDEVEVTPEAGSDDTAGIETTEEPIVDEGGVEATEEPIVDESGVEATEEPPGETDE